MRNIRSLHWQKFPLFYRINMFLKVLHFFMKLVFLVLCSWMYFSCLEMIFYKENLIVLFDSRGANFITQILLRPGASDLTGSFRYSENL